MSNAKILGREIEFFDNGSTIGMRQDHHHGIVLIDSEQIGLANILSIWSNKIVQFRQHNDNIYDADTINFKLIIPKYQISENKVAVGGYMFRTNDHLDTYSDLQLRMSSVINKNGRWKTSKNAKLSLPMTKEEALKSWNEFLDGTSDNMLLRSSVNLLYRQGNFSILESQYYSRYNVFMYPIVFSTAKSIVPWGFIQKIRSRYITYWKVNQRLTKLTGAAEAVEKAQLILNLME